MISPRVPEAAPAGSWFQSGLLAGCMLAQLGVVLKTGWKGSPKNCGTTGGYFGCSWKKERRKKASFPTPTPHLHTPARVQRNAAWGPVCSVWRHTIYPSASSPSDPPPPALWINIPPWLRKTHSRFSLNRLLKRNFLLTACQAKIPHNLPAICQFYQSIDFSGARWAERRPLCPQTGTVWKSLHPRKTTETFQSIPGSLGNSPDECRAFADQYSFLLFSDNSQHCGQKGYSMQIGHLQILNWYSHMTGNNNFRKMVTNIKGIV